MGFRTDLAIESTQSPDVRGISGVKSEEYTIDNVKITKTVIDSAEAEQKSGKPMGDYITLEVESFIRPTEKTESETFALSQVLQKLIPDGEVLVVGLGNSAITPDGIGPKTLEHIFATRHINTEGVQIEGLESLRSVGAIATGVLGQTGMESAQIVKSVCGEIKPAAVIAIDALACSDISRLASTVQITNTGISPGSGVQNSRKELSEGSLGVPVIAIGVPTVVDMSTIAESISKVSDSRYSSMMVTPREIDTVVSRSAKMISLAVNKALNPSLSFEDIECLTC